MTKADRLRIEALDACNWRGHEMSRFIWRLESFHHTCGHSICRKCGMEVGVDPNPPPNGVDIGGEAVSLNCPF